MLPILKIDHRVSELNDSQAFIYFIIAFKVKRKETVNRSYFCKALQVTNKDYISEIISTIKEKKLIGVDYKYYGFSGEGSYDKEYVFTVPESNSWFPVSYRLLDSSIPPKVRGFAIRYRSLALDDSLMIKKSKTEIARLLNISRTTLNVRLDLLKAYDLLPESFPTFAEDNVNLKTEAEKSYKEIVKNNKKTDCPQMKIEKQLKWFLDNKIYKKTTGESIYLEIISGTFNKKIKQVNEFNFNE